MSAGTVRQDLLSEIETWKAATKREARRADEALRMHEEHTRRANERLAEVEAERDRLKTDALPIAFADCEALVSAGLLALAEKEDGLAAEAYRLAATHRQTSVRAAANASLDRHKARAACLREMSLAVSLGRFRTVECNEKAIVAAHREAAGFNSSKAGGEARSRALSPEERAEIARRGAVLRFWEPACKHGTDAMVTLDGDVWCHLCQKPYQRKPARARWAAKKGE